MIQARFATIQASQRASLERLTWQHVCQRTHLIHEITMRLFFLAVASFLVVACGHVTPSGDSGNNGNISGSSVTPYGVIDTGVTRTINR
jgi:hypothetical protein